MKLREERVWVWVVYAYGIGCPAVDLDLQTDRQTDRHTHTHTHTHHTHMGRAGQRHGTNSRTPDLAQCVRGVCVCVCVLACICDANRGLGWAQPSRNRRMSKLFFLLPLFLKGLLGS